MAYCIFKVCCGCFELKLASLALGYILLAFDMISLLSSTVNIIVFYLYVPKDRENLHSMNDVFFTLYVICEVIFLWETVWIIVILTGLHRNKRKNLVIGYPSLAVCYAVDIALMIYGLLNISIEVYLINDALTLLVANVVRVLRLAFILMVRSHYHQMNEKNGEVYTEEKNGKRYVYNNPSIHI